MSAKEYEKCRLAYLCALREETSELDDLVDGRAVVIDTAQDILRGATKKD